VLFPLPGLGGEAITASWLLTQCGARAAFAGPDIFVGIVRKPPATT
jgi:hypothetical protein